MDEYTMVMVIIMQQLYAAVLYYALALLLLLIGISGILVLLFLWYKKRHP